PNPNYFFRSCHKLSLFRCQNQFSNNTRNSPNNWRIAYPMIREKTCQRLPNIFFTSPPEEGSRSGNLCDLVALTDPLPVKSRLRDPVGTPRVSLADVAR